MGAHLPERMLGADFESEGGASVDERVQLRYRDCLPERGAHALAND